MATIVTLCPSCGSDLRATRLACEHCQTQLEGQFDIPPLLRLSPEDLSFVTAFVRSSGSLKEMAQLTSSSYPTVRNRLNAILKQLDDLERASRKRQHEILDAVEQGKMTAKQAARELKKVQS